MARNKKKSPKKNNRVPLSIRRKVVMLNEAVKELTDADEVISVGSSECIKLLILLSKKISLHAEENGHTPNNLIMAHNFANVSKGLRILLNDLKVIRASCTREKLQALDDFNLPMMCLQYGQQYAHLGDLLQNRFLPAIMVMDDAIEDHIKTGAPVTEIAIGPTMEHLPNGVIVPHTEEEGVDFLKSELAKSAEI